MKKSNVLILSLFAFFLTTLFIACSPEPNEASPELTIIKSENSALLKFTADEKIGEIKGEALNFSVDQAAIKSVMESNYRDGTSIDELYMAKEEGQYYLYGKGYNTNNESRIIRYVLTSDGNGNLRTVDGGTDSCAGVNCAYCVFTAGSGCDCRRRGDQTFDGFDKASYCNHSTSSGVAALELLDVAIENASVTGANEVTGQVQQELVDPALYDLLSQGEPFVTDTDFVISEETMSNIYANSGLPSPAQGPVTIAAGSYDVVVDQAQEIIIIVIETKDVVIVIVIIN